MLCIGSGFEGSAKGCSCPSFLHKPEAKPKEHWIWSRATKGYWINGSGLAFEGRQL